MCARQHGIAFACLAVLLFTPGALRCVASDGIFCREVADIVFVVDSSGSINEHDQTNWDRVKNFSKMVVDELKIGRDFVRVGMVEFGNEAHIQFYLDTHYNAEDIKTDIDKMPFLDANTNTSGGIYFMMNYLFNASHGDRPNAPNVGIVITDGISTYDHNLTIPYAMEAKRRDIHMFAIGIGDKVNQAELEGIASPNSALRRRSVVTVGTFKELKNAMRIVCVDVTTPTTPTPSTTTLLTSAATPSTTATSTAALTATYITPPGCDAQAHVAVIIDRGFNEDLAKMKTFVTTFLQLLDVTSGNIQVSVIVFGEYAEIFYSRRPSILSDVIEVVNRLSNSRDITVCNLASAFRRLRQEILSLATNDRPLYVLVLTKQGSTFNQTQTLEEVKRLKSDYNAFVMIVATDNPNWIENKQIDSIASSPISGSIFRQRIPDLTLAYQIQGLICNGSKGCQKSPCYSRWTVSCTPQPGGQAFCQCRAGHSGKTCGRVCLSPVHLMIGLDTSRSIGWSQFELATSFAQSIATSLEPHSDVGLVAFSDTARLVLNLTSVSSYVLGDLMTSAYDGAASTDTAGALFVMCSLMSSMVTTFPRVVLVVVDGRSNDVNETLRQARTCWDAGISLIAVGVGGAVGGDMYAVDELVSMVNPDLELIADQSGNRTKRLYFVPDFASLANISSTIINSLCRDNRSCESSPCKNGGKCVDLIDDYKCVCNAVNSTGRNCERAASGLIDLVFAVDTSGRIQRERFPIVQSFITQIISNLDIGVDRTMVGALSWSDNVDIDFRLDDYVTRFDLMQAVDSTINYVGNTSNASALALSTLRTQMYSSTRRSSGTTPLKVAIVITNGNSDDEAQLSAPEAVKLHQAGVHVITVSVGTLTNQIELRAMATRRANRNMFHVDSYRDLLSLVTPVISAFTNDVDECASNPCQQSATCTDNLGYYTCRCPEYRTGNVCQYECENSADLAIVIDMSGSISDLVDQKLRIARKLVEDLELRPCAHGGSRVALVTYAATPVVWFTLSTYTNKSEVLEAFDIIPVVQQGTDTSSALNLTQSHVFDASRGDRSGIANVAVVITDGMSNINHDKTIPSADAARNASTKIFVVGVGSVDATEALGIAGSSANYWRVTSDQEGDAAAHSIAEILCTP